MLPVEVLKACKGSIVLNIYEPGSQHVDKVDTQNFYGDRCPKTPKEKDTAAPPSPNHPFDESTPLSALFREAHHGQLREMIDSWRPYLIGDDPGIDALSMTRFEFDFKKVIATSIYIDLGRLLHDHALKDDNMSQLADYLYQHSNLSNSQSTLYAQLRKYKKR